MSLFPESLQDDFGDIIVLSTENANFNACVAFIMSANHEAT